MKIRWNLAMVAAASMWIGVGVAVAQGQYGREPRPEATGATAQPAGATTQPAGAMLDAKSSQVRDIGRTMADTADNALTRKGLSNLVSNLVEADRARINRGDTISYNDVDSRVDEINKAWREKYKQPFGMGRNDEMVFGGDKYHFHAATGAGAGGEAARPAGERMTPQTQPSGERPAPAPAPAGTELEAARVRVPGNYSLPEMTLQFRRETINNWRMDIPDSVDARKLHDNLLHHLNHVWEAKDRWPDDVNEAYRFVSQHVFAALYDQRMTGGGENQQR